MSETTITQLSNPSGFGSDPFTDVLRDGARKLIEQAIHAELAALLANFSGEKPDDGRARLVRQADDVGAEEMAQTRRPKPPSRGHRRG